MTLALALGFILLMTKTIAMNEGLQIGEVAKRAGLRIDTLRYYEKVKLLPRPGVRREGFDSLLLNTLTESASLNRLRSWDSHLMRLETYLATGGTQESARL